MGSENDTPIGVTLKLNNKPIAKLDAGKDVKIAH